MNGQPIGHRDGVIRAVKIASGARLSPTGLEFTPVNPFVYERIPVTADARCLAAVPRHDVEPVPGVRCTCGFWGCRSLAAALTALGRDGLRCGDVVLSVELSGRVVEHDHGWRAAHQEVAAVLFQRRCERCGSRRRVRLCVGPGDALHPRCERCVNGVRLVELSELPVPASWLPGASRLHRSAAVAGCVAVPLR